MVVESAQVKTDETSVSSRSVVSPSIRWILGGCRWLALLSLGFILGGMLVLGAVVAPAIFHQLPLEQAGWVMAGIFKTIDTVFWVGAGFVVACQLVTHWLNVLNPSLKRQSVLRQRAALILAGALWASLSYSVFVIHPEIASFQQAAIHRQGHQPEARQFDQRHKEAEGLYKLDVLMVALLLGVIGL